MDDYAVLLQEALENPQSICDERICGECQKSKDVSCPWVPFVKFTDEQMVKWMRGEE